MQRKLEVWWRGGIIETNPLTGTITIRQGTNVITVAQSERYDFEEDISQQPYVESQPTGVGFGGSIEKLPDKKPKMDNISRYDIHSAWVASNT